MKFASTLKLLREQNHVTQKELADYLKVTRSTIAGYETKGKQPDYERLLRIAAYFGVSADYLLTGSKLGIITTASTAPERGREILISYLHLSSESQRRLEEYLHLLMLKEQNEGKGQMEAGS